MKKKKIIFIILITIFVLVIGMFLYILYEFNVIPHKKYSNSDFGIDTYISSVDYDGDGIDDQSDILENVRKYISTNPEYKSKYYAGGYSNDEYGVCTDVVANGMRGSGYDLMHLVNEHINNNRDLYNIDKVDKNIDFRRVQNLRIYFKNTAISLTTDVYDLDEWQGGDIVIFDRHIGIDSDKRKKNGVPFLIHHANPYQINYEEDVLENRNDIIGHYRIS